MTGLPIFDSRDGRTIIGQANGLRSAGLAIRRSIESCETMGYNPDDHFRGVTKMIELGKGAKREIEDFMLTRSKAYIDMTGLGEMPDGFCYAISFG